MGSLNRTYCATTAEHRYPCGKQHVHLAKALSYLSPNIFGDVGGEIT